MQKKNEEIMAGNCREAGALGPSLGIENTIKISIIIGSIGAYTRR